MDTFLNVMRMRIYMAAENCFGIYWPEWRRPVEDLILYSDATEQDCEELKQAKDEAVRALQRLKEVTEATLRKVRKEICETNLKQSDTDPKECCASIPE